MFKKAPPMSLIWFAVLVIPALVFGIHIVSSVT
jgi:hypothetical protein